MLAVLPGAALTPNDGRLGLPRGAGDVGLHVDEDRHLTRCARDVEVMVCPWDRRDDPRHRIAVTVHALALAAPLRVDTFHGVPLPAGGVELGPPGMRQTMVGIHYPRHGKHLVRDVTAGLKRDRWTVVNVPSGDEDRMFPPDYTQIRASKSGATVRLTVLGGDSMVFVTRGP